MAMSRLQTILALCATLAACASAQAQPQRLRAEVTALVGGSAVHAGTDVRAALAVSLPDGYHVQSDAPRNEYLIPTVLTIHAPDNVTVTELDYPPSHDLKQVGVDELLAIFDTEFAIGVQMAVGPEAAEGVLDIPASLRYQMCDDRQCYPPTTAEASFRLDVVSDDVAIEARHAGVLDGLRFGEGSAPPSAPAPAPQAALAADSGAQPAEDGIARLEAFGMLGSAGGYLNADEFLTFISNAENGVQEPGIFDGRGPLAIMLIVLVGGLALNLTPCVLPMIPINLAIIGAGAQAGTRRRGFLLGSTYGAAMALVYGALGLIVILTAGTFGTINASPWFNLSIAVLFVVLALAMFDVLTIDFSKLSSRWRPKDESRSSFMLAFSMGAVAALLAGACVAPVVIQVVLLSGDLYAAGITAALVLPFLLGVGMALPWPVAGAGIAALPKPGKWMVHVKHAFGVVIMITAVYYGYVAYGIFENRWVDPASVASSVEEKLDEGWYADMASGLAAAQAEGKPVLIDMWATWCKNCLTMDKTTLADAEVVAALDDYVKIKFQAEDPDSEPARTVMQRYDAVGLPAYVILEPVQ